MLKVMTRNLFIGADLTSAYEALTTDGELANLPAVVREIFNAEEPAGLVQRSNFPARASAFADEIDANRPDLIGIQEAPIWRTRDPSEPDAPTQAFDHLAMLEAEIAKRGLRYRRILVVDNGDVEMPSAAGGTVGLKNRGAILVREDWSPASNPQTKTFDSVLPIATPLGDFVLTRGWGSVDVLINGQSVRFITTHLPNTPAASGIQLLQVDELVAGPAATSMPVVMAGDFNSAPGTRGYENLMATGFTDAWTRSNADGPGHTCCHFPLDDPLSSLEMRIDLILTRGGITAEAATVAGDQPGDFRDGLWPSDHAGVVASLRLR